MTYGLKTTQACDACVVFGVASTLLQVQCCELPLPLYTSKLWTSHGSGASYCIAHHITACSENEHGVWITCWALLPQCALRRHQWFLEVKVPLGACWT